MKLRVLLLRRGRAFGMCAGASYVDIFPLMREQMRSGMTAPDGLHPSAAAYAQWADALKHPLGPR